MMQIIFDKSKDVFDKTVFNEVFRHSAEPKYIAGNHVVGGIRVLPESTDVNKLNLKPVAKFIDDTEKLIIHYYAKVGHTVLETILPLAYAVKINPKWKVIIDMTELTDDIEKGNKLNLKQEFGYSLPHFEFIKKMLNFYGIEYELVSFGPKEIMMANNFSYYINSAARSAMLDAFMMVLDDMYPHLKGITPFRKIYISRQKTMIHGLQDIPQNIKEEDEIDYYFRILKERKLETFLKEHGYEIVHFEDFQTFDEQIEFMKTVKVMLSATCSGMNNMLLMNPGQTIVELFTTMTFNTPVNPVENLHAHYHAIGYYCNHLYISLPLISKEADWIIEQIKTNKYLKGLLID